MGNGFKINGKLNSFGANKPIQQAVMIASGGLSGGISSAIAGGNFWDGVRQGLITTGLNHAAHGMLKGGKPPQGKANSRDNTKSVGVMQSDQNPTSRAELVQKTASAFSIANEAKMSIIEAANLGKMGNTAATYIKIFKGAGGAAALVTTAYSTSKAYQQFQRGGTSEMFSHRDVLDASVGGVGVIATTLTAFGVISNPVGWGIGIGVVVYSSATLIYDAATSKP